MGITCPKPAGRRCWVATAGDCTYRGYVSPEQLGLPRETRHPHGKGAPMVATGVLLLLQGYGDVREATAHLAYPAGG